jgi:gamma-glutamyltranspeptidase/glutathione hydrolase
MRAAAQLLRVGHPGREIEDLTNREAAVSGRFARRGPAVAVVAVQAAALISCAGAPDAGSTETASDERVTFPVTNRPDVRGVAGAVSSDHPLASAAGYEVLRRGGNAVDAAITMAGVLAVVRPHMNGVGGDAFALFYDGRTRRVTGMNGSGRAGALATPAFFVKADGTAEVPGTGARSVSVPGAVAAWADALARFGSISLAEALAPAIRYAREGFPVSTRLADDFRSQSRALNEAGRSQYLPGGSPPPVGSLLKNPALAATLERIAARGRAGFYEGEVAGTLSRFLEAEGGYLRADDFRSHSTTWVEPISAEYRGHRILVLPPNTQGFAQLQQLVMAESFDLAAMGHNSADYLHTLIELKKIAFADRDQWASDPDFTDIPMDRLLAADYLRERAALVDAGAAKAEVGPGIRPAGAVLASRHDPADRDDSGDTVYLTAVDGWGNAVSWIQSLFAGFGSGLYEPETGVMLQNRGALFTLEEGHPNQVAPGKRPYHTLTPLLALDAEGRLAFTLGTPGGDSQTQSLFAILNNLLLFGMTPQQAIEAPRYRGDAGLEVLLEDRIPAEVREELARRGHELTLVHGWTATFGGAQMIRVEPGTRTLTVGSDPRREAYGIAY